MTGPRRRQIDAAGYPVRVVEAGVRSESGIVLLHGWPQSAAAFEPVMAALGRERYAVAFDLPGIGDSAQLPKAFDKRTLAEHVRAVIAALELYDVTLAGHDVGGMIVYAYLRAYPDQLRRAVILNTVIPGVDPWSEVQRNPKIWHFAFHNVPSVPEMLVAGRVSEYFASFFETLAARPDAVPAVQRARYAAAYARKEALHAGFEWYRAFAQDEKENRATLGRLVKTPVLYVRGDRDTGSMERYAEGLRNAGLLRLETRVLANCGHFAPDERPEELAALLAAFVREHRS